VTFSRSPSGRAFTLVEVILALGILGLLSGAIYGISSAALDATRATLEEQVSVRRLESFLRVTRNAFVNLPAEGSAYLRITKASNGAPVPEIVFSEASGVFGIPSLGGGTLILAARPRADGSRTLSLRRVPREDGRPAAQPEPAGSWLPLLPRVEKVKWFFFANGEWREEWPEGSGRPAAVRLQMDYLDIPGRKVSADFWLPPVQQQARQEPTPEPTPPAP
jgi:prepilin-type N-terminal cleavage/methylation domain-containing protein